MSTIKFFPSEAQSQATVVEWAGWHEKHVPELGLLFHIPNGGSRPMREAVNFKAQGVKAGVPDLCLPVAKQTYHGLFIEMKTVKGKPSIEQSKWIGHLKQQGYAVFVCNSSDEAIDKISWYLGMKTAP